MTTPPVVSITDELIAELESAANAAGGAEWMLIDGEMRMEADNRYVTSQDRIDDNKMPFAEIHYGNPDAGMGEPFQGEQVAAGDFMALANPATILALLAERAEFLKIISERLEPASPGTKSKRENWLINIRDAQKFGLPRLLSVRLDNTAKEIENSIRYGGTQRLRNRISDLEAERTSLKKQLAAASVDAGRYRFLRNESVNADGDTVMAAKIDGAGDQISNWFFGAGLDAAIDAALDIAAMDIGSGD